MIEEKRKIWTFQHSTKKNYICFTCEICSLVHIPQGVCVLEAELLVQVVPQPLLPKNRPLIDRLKDLISFHGLLIQVVPHQLLTRTRHLIDRLQEPLLFHELGCSKLLVQDVPQPLLPRKRLID